MPVTKFILVVDDNEEARTSAEISLEAVHACAVHSFENAVGALAYLEKFPHRIGALVTDLHLPQTDGFELIQRVRSDDRWKTLPIVVVSADAGLDTRQRAVSLGANAFFLKPYSPAQLLCTVERLLYANDQGSPSPADHGSGPISPDHC